MTGKAGGTANTPGIALSCRPMLPQATASRKLMNAARRAAQNPQWLRETLRTKLRARADRDRPYSLADHAQHLCSVPEALQRAFGGREDEYTAVRSQLRIPPSPEGAHWGGGQDILDLAGSIVWLRRPAVAVETGVAMGYSTAVILGAMDDNGAGELHSIDLPPLQVDPETFVGRAVPEHVRGRWTLHVGPSRRLLPALLAELGSIDLFVHDSDHSYAGQYEEYRLAWEHLAVGACLVSDDVCNAAFTDFAEEVAERPYLVAPPGQRAAVGLLVKTR
jgi:hypothetical protein